MIIFKTKQYRYYISYAVFRLLSYKCYLEENGLYYLLTRSEKLGLKLNFY